MREIFQSILGWSVFILSFVIFFCPIIISIITGNWWFILLFSVSWIGAIGTLILTKAIIDV